MLKKNINKPTVKKDNRLTRYFIITYEVILRKFFFFREKRLVHMAASTTTGLFVNKQVFLATVIRAYKKQNPIGATILYLDELRAADYVEFNRLVDGSGKPVEKRGQLEKSKLKQDKQNAQ